MKKELIATLLAFAVFANAQYQNWHLFAREASSTARSAGVRGYHK